MRMRVPSLALLSGLRIQHCHELQCRLQMWLRSGVAVAVALASSCSSDLPPSLGTSICHGAVLKNTYIKILLKEDEYQFPVLQINIIKKQ